MHRQRDGEMEKCIDGDGKMDRWRDTDRDRHRN